MYAGLKMRAQKDPRNIQVCTFTWHNRNYNTRHDDVIKWKHFPCYWPFVRGSHRSPVNSAHKGQWREASMFSLICAWINDWVNNGDAGDLRRHRARYDAIVNNENNFVYSQKGWKKRRTRSPGEWSDVTFTLWRHQIGTFSVLHSLCGGNHWVLMDSLHKATVTRTFDVSL